jgi:hypothetical protein
MLINSMPVSVKTDGAYPSNSRRLLRLVPEQVMKIVRDYAMVRDETGQCYYEGFEYHHLMNNLFLNKGYVKLGKDGDLALYKHDGKFWLIQQFDERGF